MKNKFLLFFQLMILLSFFSRMTVRADETPVPTSAPMTVDDEESNASTAQISKPAAVPTETDMAVQAPGADQKPSQGEGEKAPVQARPTAVPDFSLPEVVITGENELTIGAKRLERKANDVTLGTHDLTGMDRATNDLPGVDKTFTALSTEEGGPAKDTAFVLHAGGGLPNTYGGWGLFGQQFQPFQYLLSGYYSTWGGHATAGGFDGDRKYQFGLDSLLAPSGPFNLHLTWSYADTDAELPYQGSIRELHQGWDFGGEAHWKLSELGTLQAKVTAKTTDLDYWNLTSLSDQAQELEGTVKYTADEAGPVLNRFSVEAGGRRATSDIPAPAVGSYNWGWLALQGYFKQSEELGLTANLQAQGGDGLGLPLKFFPALDLMWRPASTSQLDLHWRTDRYIDDFQSTFMDREHISPVFGFPSPVEITEEFGGRFTQKVTERIVASISGSLVQYSGYHQWTDLNATAPVLIQDYSTLSNVQIMKAGANIQWGFLKNWQAAAAYEWQQGTDRSGSGLYLTDLPTHRGVLSLYRGEEKWEARLSLTGVSERRAFETIAGTLPAYLTVGLDATYHWTKELSFWLDGDNLLGQSYQLQPGYLEPEFHIRGGVEVIF